MLLFIGFLLISPASALALEVEPRDKSIVYGDKTVLRVSSDRKGETWQLREALWPYRDPQVAGEWPADRPTLPVDPSRNARYRVFLLDEDGKVIDQSNPRMIWVAPRVENSVQRTGSYLLASGTLRFDDFFWDSVKSLPQKQRKIYLYTRCSSRSGWRLQRSVSLRIKLFAPLVYVAWQASATLPCRRAGYRTVGFFYIPGILESGDEGLGRPQISREEARIARKLLGQEEVSGAQMKKYFPTS